MLRRLHVVTLFFPHARRLHTSVVSAYQDLVQQGTMRHDDAQMNAATEIDALLRRITKYASRRQSLIRSSDNKDIYSALTSRTQDQNDADIPVSHQPNQDNHDPNAPPPELLSIGHVPRGLYIYGPVGTGKTFLMDTLYSIVSSRNDSQTKNNPSNGPNHIPVRRVHFHSFMSEVHSRIHEWKQGRKNDPSNRFLPLTPERDAIVQVGRQIALEAWLLCFDEFQVTDIADAMIIQRLFKTLFSNGCVVISTSNRAPEDLYENGINREYFLPFISLLEKHCRVHPMGNTTDYRVLGSTQDDTKWISASGGSAEEEEGAVRWLQSKGIDTKTARAAFKDAVTTTNQYVRKKRKEWKERQMENRRNSKSEWINTPLSELELTDIRTEIVPKTNIPLMMDRSLSVRLLGSTAVVSFDEMCSLPLGAADYNGLCKHIDNILIIGVPQFRRSKHNEIRRWITFVDELYEHGINIAITSKTKQPLEVFARFIAEEEQAPLSVKPASNLTPESVKILEFSSDQGVGLASDPSSPVHVFENEYDSDDDDGEPRGVSLALSTAEYSAMKELSFACKRAASRLVEMTKVE